MTEQTLLHYKSRRNDARLVQSDAGKYVAKTFFSETGFLREVQIYNLLHGSALPCANVILASHPKLLLTQLPGQNLVECLEQQERHKHIEWILWTKLVEWLVEFHRITGYVMTDVNLRNFLYDAQTQILYGLDFEECSQTSFIEPAARLSAFILTYAPENTLIKQEIAKYVLHLFAEKCNLEIDYLYRESKRQQVLLLERRKNEHNHFFRATLP